MNMTATGAIARTNENPMKTEIPTNEIICGDCLAVMRAWPDRCLHMGVTSPPYWGLRDYGIEPSIWGGDSSCEHEWGEWKESHDVREEPSSGKSRTTDRCYGEQSRRFDGNHQKHSHGAWCTKCGAWRGCYGLEPTVELYIEHTVLIFREVRRVLRDDGTLWLNLGDSYNSNPSWGRGKTTLEGRHQDAIPQKPAGGWLSHAKTETLKPKDLCGIPWRVAMALQADGWYLRQDIIWHKPNPMPESVADRCTKAHEYLFMLSKSPRYYYDAEAIKEEGVGHQMSREEYAEALRRTSEQWYVRVSGTPKSGSKSDNNLTAGKCPPGGRNKRSVWTVATAPFKEAHFATFPPDLIRPCIRAGTSAKGCCPKCGAPWQRVVRKSGSSRNVNDVKLPEQHLNDGDRRSNNRQDVSMSTTIGWRPTCECCEPEWSERCDVLFEGLAAKRRSRDARKRWQQDKANRWYERAYRYADACLMPREHPMFGADPCTVFDPFMGAGTTAIVAAQERRDYIGIEIKPEYCDMARRRVAVVEVLPLFEAAAATERGEFVNHNS
jgi:DNA modification methylase